MKLKAYFLRNSISNQLLGQFQRQLGSERQVELKPTSSLNDLWVELQQWHADINHHNSGNLNSGLNVIGLGDYWLAKAIEQNLIEPLEPTALSHWAQIPERWQRLVTRDNQGNVLGNPAASQGKVWAAPYRWGATVIAYRRDKFEKLGWVPTDWADLWRPELQGRLSLLDHPREVIGLTLKKLGKSYNTPNPAEVSTLATELAQLNRQTKFYSSDAYLQPLLLGNTWVAVGWSTDILPEARQDDQIQVVVPKAGTALWADLWVQPTRKVDQGSGATQFLNQWIDFWWQPDIARQLSRYGNGLSALDFPPRAQPNREGFAARVLLANSTAIERSEFLSPLTAATINELRTLWKGMRQPVS